MNRGLITKLQFVHRRAPLLLQPRIAFAIEALNNSYPIGVQSPLLRETKPKNTPLLILQDNADSFLALMRTLPKKSPFKEAVSEMGQLADKLAEKIEQSGLELSKILETDEEDLPGIKASALGELAGLLQSEKSKLADIQELTKTLSTLAGNANKEEKTSPVEHDLKSKDVGAPKKKESPSIGEDTGIEDLPNPDGSPSKGSTPTATP